MGLIDCLGKVQGISAEAAKKMQKLHAERVKDGMSEEEVLRIERDIVLDHVNTLHEKMNTLRKKAKMKAVKYEKFDDTEAVGQVKAKYNKVEQPVKAEPTAKEAVAASADDRPVEAKRKEFLSKMYDKDFGDFPTLIKLSDAKKGIKLDAIAKKINAAFSDGIITEDDYNTLADSVDHDYSVLKMDKTMQRVSGTIAAKTEVKVAEEKKPTVRKEKKKEPKLSRQERLNKLMDKAEEYNRERKQSVKAVLLNEMRIEAKKINVVVDAHKGFARIMLESGKKAQRRATETNKSEVSGFDPNTYSEQTQSIVDRFKDASAIREMLPDIIGTDGKSLSVDQKSAMLEALRSGKVTAEVKAMYDSFEAMLENGYIDVKENATGEVVGVPVDEYLSFFDQEAEVEDIVENEEILGGWKPVTDTAFEDINEILYETNNESDQGETGNTYAGGTENFQEEMGSENSARKTIEQQNIEDQLEVAMEELSAARSAFESKRAQLDKGLMQDQENLFGERDTPQDLLFDERASASARNEAIVPFKERVERAKREVEFLQRKLDEVSGMPTSQTSFDDALPKLGSYSGPVAGDMTNPERLSDLTTALNEAATFYGKVPSIQRAIAFIRNIVAKNKNIRIDTAVRNFDKGEYRGVKIDPSALGYSFPDGTIIINFDKIGNNADMLYSTVLHELNHAAVRNEINTNAAFREELNGVLAGLREAFGVPNHEGLVRAMYLRGLIDADLQGLVNEHELLAELFSNEGFYDMLKGIEYKGENLLEKFFRIVAAWFSKKYKMLRDAKSGATDNNLADYLMTLTERVVTGEASSLDGVAMAMENKERASIISKAKADGTYMLAPNGKKTNLTEDQWTTVRTKNFKDWFGDWENDPKNASKVVDENGEPKVVYHGAIKSGFSEFDASKMEDARSDYRYIGIENATWFTDKREVAVGYSGSDKESVVGVSGPGIISSFLNIRNPLERDFHGADFNGESDDLMLINSKNKHPKLKQKENGDNWKVLQTIPDGEYYTLTTSWEDAQSLVDELQQTDENADHQSIYNLFYSTDSTVAEAVKKGNDGAIMKNVNDNGGLIDEYYESNVYAAFSPNQIKSATANSGAFNPNDNRIYASQRIYKEDSDINESDIITSAAAMIESGGSIDDAIDAAVEARQYQTYSDKFSKRELKKIIKARFKELGIIDGGKKINYKKLIQSFIKKPNVSGIRGAFMRATKNMKKGAAEVRLNQKFLLDYLRENGVELSKKRMERVVSIIVGASKIVNQSDVLYKSLSEIDKVIQDQISEDNELRYEEGIKSFSEKIKTQFRERFIREKAMNKGAANQAALTRDLIGMATLYFKVTGVDLSKNRIVSLLNQIKKLSTSNSPFEVFNDISDMMDAIVLQQTNSDNLINCKNALKKIRKVSKGSNIQDVDRNFLRGLQFPTAAKVLRLMGAKSLSDYMNILNEVSKAYSTKQGIRLMSKARVIWFIETLNKRLIEKEQELISKRLEYAKKSGDVPEGTTIEEYMVMIHDSSKNSQNKSYKDTISGIIKDLQDALLDSYEENSSVAKELKSLDISNMDMDGLKKLNNILNNILNDEDFDGSEAILAKYKDANENLKKLEDPKNALKVRPLNSSSGMLTGKVANLKTFTNFISSLFYDDASRAKFRSILFGLLDKTLSNSKKEIDATAKEITKLYAKHKLKLESDFRLSVYAFLNQHLGDPDTSFADRLDKLITDGVEKLYSDAAARTNSIRKKDQLQQATETANALKSMGLIEDFQISENKRFITVKRIDGLTSGSLNGVLSAGEQELYNYAQSKFNSIVDGVERTARNVYGLDFVRWQNYFPMIPKRMSDENKATGDEEVQDQFEIYGDMDKKVSKQPSDRLKNRGKLAGNDKYYQMGFLDGFLNGYNQALISSTSGRHLVALAHTANSDKFGRFLSGAFNEQIDGIKDNFDENKKIFREKLSEVVRDKLQAPFMFRSHQDWGRRMVSGFMNHVVRTWLARADQFVLQYAPNWMATATEVGVPSTTRATAIQIASIYDKEMRASYEKFLSNFSGQFRASMGMEAFDEQLKRFDDSSITYTAGKVLDTLNIVGISALKFADKGANNVSLIAAYINYLVKIGELKSVSDFDIETAADNLNPEAMAYAEQIAGRVNNESDKANRAHVTKNHEGSPFTFMWLLKGYSLNAYQEGMSSLKVAFSNRATGKQKAEGLRHFSTYMTQIVVFNGLKALAISPALNLLSQSLLPVLFGVAPDEESENEKKQRQQKRFARVAANVLSDATLAGVPEPVEEAAKEGANMLFKAAQGLMKDGKKDNKGVMDPRFSPYFAGSGALGGGAMLVDGGKTIHKAFTEETNNIYPYDVNQALDKLDYAQLAALVMRNGDMWRLTNSLEQELMKKRRTGGGSGLPKLPTLPKLNLPKIGR